MSLTVSQKILAEHAGLKSVEPGEIVKAKIDVAMAAVMKKMKSQAAGQMGYSTTAVGDMVANSL